jgi:enoyl-CoA hydratase
MGSVHISSTRDGRVGIVAINRPEALNALSRGMVDALAEALLAFDADDEVRVALVHGSNRAFSAGADLSEMQGSSAIDWYRDDPLGVWDRLVQVRTPIVAAVNGYALGGGCELALVCDLIIAGESARFGQPEIKVGIIPGAGGTQRLIRAVGKALAMDMILTGRMISAAEALAAGLISRVVPDDECLEVALQTAQDMAKLSPLALRIAKEAVLKAQETALGVGLREERNLFHLLTASQDHDEGIQAFLEKRPPEFTGR